MKKRKLNKKRLVLFILIVACACSSLVFCVSSFAKYVTQDSEKALVIPANFIFNSNYLKETNASYNIYDSNEEIIIELYNTDNINKSEVDIPYSVSVINGTSSINNGILTTEEDTDTITITTNNKNDPIMVYVSCNTYDYSLSASFNFTSIEINSKYSFTDSDKYCELTIFTGNINVNNITVNWDSKYIPDNTNLLMNNWSGTSGTLSLNRSTKYNFIFFKNTNNICSNITNAEIQNSIITLP